MSTEYPLDVILLVICFLATAFNFKYKRMEISFILKAFLPKTSHCRVAMIRQRRKVARME